MSSKDRFKQEIDTSESSDLLVTTLGVMAVGLVCFSFLLLSLSFSKTGRKRAINLIQEFKQKTLWNSIIMMTYANYLNLVLKSRNQIITKLKDDENLAAGIFWGTLLLIYPLLIAKFLHHNHKQLNSLDFRKKYENFYKEVKVLNHGRRAIFFYPFFLAKRWIFMSIIVITNNTGLQFFALLNINKASVIIYGWMNPHVTRQRKWQEYFNEVMMMLLAYTMLCMTSFLLDNQIIFDIGYVFIIMFGVLLAGNLSYIFYIQYTRWSR
jgi:hypothetical protein